MSWPLAHTAGGNYLESLTKLFAPDRERTPEGWLKYQRDTALRRSMYSKELADLVMSHPAKQQAHLHKDICEYVSNPGDTILDPFGGIGTSLLSATLGRNVVLCEIEDYYCGIIRSCISELGYKGAPGLGRMILIQSDNRLALPIPCDHIITSPPYGNDLVGSDWDNGYGVNSGTTAKYTASPQNLGMLNPFIYKQAMNKVYGLMVKSVKVGGTITITHRDRMRDGQRILYVDSIVGTLVKLGCRVHYLDKWNSHGVRTNYNKSIGQDVVEDEDIIIMVRKR